MNETDWLRSSTYSWFLTQLKWLTRDDELNSVNVEWWT